MNTGQPKLGNGWSWEPGFNPIQPAQPVHPKYAKIQEESNSIPKQPRIRPHSVTIQNSNPKKSKNKVKQYYVQDNKFVNQSVNVNGYYGIETAQQLNANAFDTKSVPIQDFNSKNQQKKKRKVYQHSPKHSPLASPKSTSPNTTSSPNNKYSILKKDIIDYNEYKGYNSSGDNEEIKHRKHQQYSNNQGYYIYDNTNNQEYALMQSVHSKILPQQHHIYSQNNAYIHFEPPNNVEIGDVFENTNQRIRSVSEQQQPQKHRRNRSKKRSPKPRSKSPHKYEEYHETNNNNNNDNENNHEKTDKTTILKKMAHQSRSARVMSSNGAKSTARLTKGKLAEEYYIKEKLGKGNFAVVRRVVRKVDSKQFAAKIISKKHLSEAEKDELENECQILQKLNHPNIVQFSTIIKTPRHLYIVLELLTGGELFDRIIQKGKFTETEAANIARQIASALSYLHQNKIVHRDLKPENIIYESKKDDAKIKINDFGLSRDLTSSNKAMQTACGTPGYVAPEILKGSTYDEYVDLWSTGVIIYILLCGYPPFQAATGTTQMYRKIKRGQYSFPSPAWDKITLIAKDCVKGLLTVDPKQRMSAVQLLEHPWVKQSNVKNVDKGYNLMNEEFTNHLTNYLHRKRFRRGVSLVITLNRMIRAAGLENVAREQRSQFRKKIIAYKKVLKANQKRIYDQQQQQKKMGMQAKDFIYEEIIDPNITPHIDFSIFN